VNVLSHFPAVQPEVLIQAAGERLEAKIPASFNPDVLVPAALLNAAPIKLQLPPARYDESLSTMDDPISIARAQRATAEDEEHNRRAQKVLKSVFKRFDADGSGALDVDELGQVMTLLLLLLNVPLVLLLVLTPSLYAGPVHSGRAAERRRVQLTGF